MYTHTFTHTETHTHTHTHTHRPSQTGYEWEFKFTAADERKKERKRGGGNGVRVERYVPKAMTLSTVAQGLLPAPTCSFLSPSLRQADRGSHAGLEAADPVRTH